MQTIPLATLGSNENAFTVQVDHHCEVYGNEQIDQAPYFIYGLGRLAQFLDPGKTPVLEDDQDPSNKLFVELPFKEINYYDLSTQVETFTNVKVSTSKNSFGDLNYVLTFVDEYCAFGWMRPCKFDLSSSYICNQVYGFFKFTVDPEVLAERFPKISIGRFLEACDYFLGGGSIAVRFFVPKPLSPVINQMASDMIAELAE